MTDGATRRTELMKILRQESRPLSGTELAKRFGVSRQVIVQDIAPVSYTHLDVYKRQARREVWFPIRLGSPSWIRSVTVCCLSVS